MMAVDTSSLVAYFSGEEGRDVDLVDRALQSGAVFLPCVCYSELLASPNLPKDMGVLLQSMPILYSNNPDFWQRVGHYRCELIKNGKKSRLADTMIATLCMDYHMSLLTRDRDFRHFLDFGLVLV